jgi:hypothetical protein
VSDAVPIPGLLDGLRPTVQAARGAPAPGSGQAAAAALLSSAAAALPPGVAVERRLVEAALPAVEQLGTVLDEVRRLVVACSPSPGGYGRFVGVACCRANRPPAASHAPTRPPRRQVGDGVTEFTPTPSESRALIASAYRVPRTLLVRFEDDGIDETPEMAALLAGALSGGSGSEASGSEGSSGGEEGSGSSGGGAWSTGEWSDTEGAAASAAARVGPGPLPPVRELLLPGTHLTPCGADLDLGAVGGALGLARARESGQADVRRLVREVSAYALAAAGEARQGRGRGGGAAGAAAVAPAAGARAAAAAAAAVGL